MCNTWYMYMLWYQILAYRRAYMSMSMLQSADNDKSYNKGLLQL